LAKKQKFSVALLITPLIALLALVAYGMTRTKQRRINWKVIEGTDYAELVPYMKAQAIHESKNYTSGLFKANNNAFGMGRPKKRKTLDNRKGNYIVEGQVMANFDSPTDSAKDLLLWFDYNRFPKSVNSLEQYVTNLKGLGYFTDTVTNYYKALKKYV
jgi:uncharacterized FlgJ-related protein